MTRQSRVFRRSSEPHTRTDRNENGTFIWFAKPLTPPPSSSAGVLLHFTTPPFRSNNIRTFAHALTTNVIDENVPNHVFFTKKSLNKLKKSRVFCPIQTRRGSPTIAYLLVNF